MRERHGRRMDPEPTAQVTFKEKVRWSEEEDMLIRRTHQQFGDNWELAADLLDHTLTTQGRLRLPDEIKERHEALVYGTGEQPPVVRSAASVVSSSHAPVCLCLCVYRSRRLHNLGQASAKSDRRAALTVDRLLA